MYEYALYAYVTAIGFVVGGLLNSFTALVTGRPLTFAFEPGTAFSAFTGVIARVFAGPVIIMRNTIRGAIVEGREAHWLALATLIATFWSFFSGAVVLELLATI